MVRFEPDDLAALDGWIAQQDSRPSRPQAIRRILHERMIHESEKQE